MMICRTAPRKGGSPISKRFLGITHEPPRGSRPLNPLRFSALAWVSLEGSYGLLRPPPVGRKSHYPSRSGVWRGLHCPHPSRVPNLDSKLTSTEPRIPKHAAICPRLTSSHFPALWSADEHFVAGQAPTPAPPTSRRSGAPHWPRNRS